MKIRPSYCLIIWVLLTATCSAIQESKRIEFKPPPNEMIGTNFVPFNLRNESRSTKEDFQKAMIPLNLSDWEQLTRLDEIEIESVRLFGFQALSDDFSCIDNRVKDARDLVRFKAAVSSKYILRPCISDVGRSFGSYGGGDYVGVIAIGFKGEEKPLIIGVGQNRFYLGVWFGGNRNAFFSNALASTLSTYLKETESLTIDNEMLDRISGRNRFDFDNTEKTGNKTNNSGGTKGNAARK